MLPAARVGDPHACPLVDVLKPHGGGPINPPGRLNVKIGGPTSARLAEIATCVGPLDVIAMGAATVLIGQLPAARQTDKTVHGGAIVTGLPSVLIGGPAFSLPPNFKFKGGAGFQSLTIRDLYLLSTTPSGAALIARLGASGQPVTFVPESNPSNSFCSPDSSLKAMLGIPTGSTISYNPNVAVNVFDASGNLIGIPPQVVLGHEMGHGLANAEGTHRYGTDSAPPASEPNMEEEEAQAIGVGSHTGQNPSENSLRSDLGLPPRANHFGQACPPGTALGPNLRPGGP